MNLDSRDPIPPPNCALHSSFFFKRGCPPLSSDVQRSGAQALATSPRSLRADAQFMRIAVAIDHECLRFATGALAATTRDDDDAGGARARRREEVALRSGLVGYEIPEHLLVVPCV